LPASPRPAIEEIASTLQAAVGHHQAGRLSQAEAIYQQILQMAPNHPDALHLLGMIAYQLGKHDIAVELINRALVFVPDFAEAHNNLGNALKDLGRLEEAAASYHHALKLKPHFAEAHNNLGIVFKEQGRLEEAVKSYQQACRLKPDYVEAHSNLGVVLKNLGRLEEAATSYYHALKLKPHFAEAHNNLGIVLKEQGRLEEAASSYQTALSLKPNFVEAHNNLAGVLHAQGRLNEAVACYQKALSVRPNFAEAHNNLGSVFQAQRRLDEAVACYHNALSLKPDYVEAHSNLGVALQDLGRLEEAAASYGQALRRKPNYAEAHNNLGNALREQGRLDEASASYQQALLLKPNFAEAHNNLGSVRQAQGRLDDAVAWYQKALLLKPDYADAYTNLGVVLQDQGKWDEAFLSHIQALRLSESAESRLGFARCVSNVQFIHAESNVQLLLARAISEAWDTPSALTAAAISLIEKNQVIKECIDRANNAWPRYLTGWELLGSSGLALAADEPLLRCLLENVQINSMEFERFLTMARRAMLERAMAQERSSGAATVASDELDDKVLVFYCALARQCFINEYVFANADEELAQVESIRERLVSNLKAKAPIPVIWPVAVAAYSPLASLPSVDALLELHWPDAVAALFVQQVREPQEEQHYRNHIPRLTAIDDGVSRLVQEQYEENPYPRWVKVPSGAKACTVDAYFHQQLPGAPFHALGKFGEVDILVAGCGTGRHSIETAQFFRGARVLAVDLSLSSLSYAKRKSHELGLLNVEFAQADIMKLETAGRSFDIIESVGVLHHLAEPVAGWRKLLDLLTPGGLMRLGFYSEIARQVIVAARNFIAERGYAANTLDIRRCRQELMAKETAVQFKQLLAQTDFYGMSGCRDLLFHVQEHRFTLLRLKEIIEALGLNFVALTVDASVAKQYMARFPDDQTRTNLDYWHLFETENPNTFAGMYQFWVQKHG
jgi:tetratricopeptide (TPR) repeat protein/SAM-dependent methyltransferase